MTFKLRFAAIGLVAFSLGGCLSGENGENSSLLGYEATDELSAQHRMPSQYLSLGYTISDIKVYLGSAGSWKTAMRISMQKYNEVEGTTVYMREVTTASEANVLVKAMAIGTDCGEEGSWNTGTLELRLNTLQNNCGNTTDLLKRTVTMHELGHAVGLTDVYSTSDISGAFRIPGTKFLSPSVTNTSYNNNGELFDLDRVALQTMWPSQFSLVADLSFSPEYYLATNRDVADAYGCQNWPFCGNFVGAREHWQNNGINEGRKQSPFFDPAYYAAMNADVNTWAKNQAQATGKSVNYWLRYHWVGSGIAEGRLASPVFNPQYYLQKYPDVNTAAVNSGNKYRFALYHWAVSGLNECRDMTASFNPCTYLAKNADIATWTEYNSYGVMNNSRWQARVRAISHYHHTGRFEGRQAI